MFMRLRQGDIAATRIPDLKEAKALLDELT
jgi:hypothetical protein